MEVELAEGVARPKAHRLGGVALAPMLLRADDDAGRRVRVDPVDRVDAGRPDRLAIRLDHPEHGVVGFAELLQRVDLVVQGDRGAPSEVTRYLHIGEPGNEARWVAVVRWTQRDVITAKNGSEHGHAE